MGKPGVGDRAPDFELGGTDGRFRLADHRGERVSHGAWRRGLDTKRAVVIVDEDGVVRHRHDHVLGVDFQSVDDIAAALDEVPARSAT